VLAVDTTTVRGSVAVVEGGEVLAELRLRSEASHSRTLLPGLDFLLQSLGLTPASVEGYVVASGPGSFTGLRIGLSTVQGLALARPGPCLGVPALDALAAKMRGAAERLVALMDAYRGEVYAAVYDAEARPLEAPCVMPPAAFLARLGPGRVAFLGDAVAGYRAALGSARPDAVFPDRELFLAGALGRLAEPRLAAGEGGPPASLRPLYVREADALQAQRAR